MAEKKEKALVADIRDMCKLTSNSFSVLRDRLIRKGLVIGDERGKLSFALPRFDYFVNNQWK